MIRMIDLRSDPEELVLAQRDAIERVLRSGWFVLGAEVAAFEELWARACGVKSVVGVGNGMDAIEIALRACGIGSGDEVITTPMTAFATVLAIIRAGATPVLADIDARTAILSTDSVRRTITAKSRAVVLVHLYGRAADMDEWCELCEATDLALIEDCAQAHGACWRGRPVGSFGAAGTFSFYPTKNLGTAGDGGALATNSPKVAASARVLRNYGQSERYHHVQFGLNSRLDEVHAALLQERLAWLHRFTERRQAIARRYAESIRNPHIELLAAPAQVGSHVYHLFVLKCERRDALASHLRANQIESLVHYPIAIHQQAICQGLRRDPRGLRLSEKHAATCLSVPCHHNLVDEQAERVIEVLNAFQ